MKIRLPAPQATRQLDADQERDRTTGAATTPVRLEFGEIKWLLLLAALGALSSLLGAPFPIRILLGLPLVLFIPGYALVSALFPSRQGLDGTERVALGFGLSLALIPLIALGIEYSPWRLTVGPILGGLLISTVVFTVVAAYRRSRLSSASRFVVARPHPRIPPPRTWDRTGQVAFGIIAISLLLLMAAGTVIIADRLQADSTTTLAIYNAEGKPESYPRQLTPNQPTTVIVEVTNREGNPEQYHLRITAANEEIGHVNGISVANNATWRQPVQITTPKEGDQIPVLFELYRKNQPAGAAPYRMTRLFMTTTTQNVTPS